MTIHCGKWGKWPKHPRILFALLVPLLLASCNQMDGHGKDEIRSENVLRYDVNAPFTSLDPADDPSSGSGYFFPFLYSYLCIPNPEGELAPDLAEKWTYDSKTFTWTISIRRGMQFHDGRQVEADDVVYSINTLLRNHSPVFFASIRKVYAVSCSRIVIVLKEDQPDYLTKIWPTEIVPQPGQNGSNGYRPIGSGPFKFASRKGNTEVTLVANEGYYGGRPKLDGIVFYYQPHKEKTWARLLSGATDVASEIDSDDYDMIKGRKEQYYFDTNCINYCTVLLFNVKDPLFSDLRTRKALAGAVDRKRIVEGVLSGFGKIPTDISPEEGPDPAKSMALLTEAGWNLSQDGRLRRDGKPFEFTIYIFDEYQVEKKVAAYLQLCFSDLGIRTQIKALPFESLAGRYRNNRDFQAVITEYRLGSSPFCPSHTGMKAGGLDPNTPCKLACQSGLMKDLQRKGISFNPTYDFVVSNQAALFLFRKTVVNVMSGRFKLRYPFCLTLEGRSRLKYASLNRSMSGKPSP
ncbi:MAG: ABC transporter substrate-binding protein [Pseudomonadota bacterium]